MTCTIHMNVMAFALDTFEVTFVGCNSVSMIDSGTHSESPELSASCPMNHTSGQSNY